MSNVYQQMALCDQTRTYFGKLHISPINVHFQFVIMSSNCADCVGEEEKTFIIK